MPTRCSLRRSCRSNDQGLAWKRCVDVPPAMSEVGGWERRGGLRIEDYALLGDTHTAALVGTNGSMDWLCLPRFDSGACFAALSGGEENGFWQIAPADGYHPVRRRYRGETLVLETDFDTAEGVVRLVDCMPRRSTTPASSGWSRGSGVCGCAWTWSCVSITAGSCLGCAGWASTSRYCRPRLRVLGHPGRDAGG